MGNFFDLIFENLFVLLVIISGIISFFGRSKDDGNKNKRRPNPTSPKQHPNRTKPPRVPFESRKPQPIQTGSMEDAKQTQIDRLAQSLNAKTNVAMEDLTQQSPTVDDQRVLQIDRSINLTKEQELLKKQMSGNMTTKGLINGIIMSEVLGPPRARKPYRSVVEERKIKY